MSIRLTYAYHESDRRLGDGQELILESRLNLLALEYGYRYRLEIGLKNGNKRIEFVRTLREARFIGMPVRRTGGLVRFYKIENDGTLRRHCW